MRLAKITLRYEDPKGEEPAREIVVTADQVVLPKGTYRREVLAAKLMSDWIVGGQVLPPGVE